MKDKLTQTKNKVASHVVRNRARYTFVAGTITGGYVTRKLDNETRRQALMFIESKGLSDEFFVAEDI